METGTPPNPMGAPSAAYNQPQYLLRRKMLHLLGGRIDIYDMQERPVMCCLQKAFKLKEDISLFTDDSKSVELLRIKARSIIDFSAAYDVVDAQTGQQLGVLRRKGWQSMIRDAWEILDPTERLVATIQEDNMALALVRRFLTNLIPQSFAFMTPDGQPLATAHQRFNPFIHKMDLVMPQGSAAGVLDPRMVMAAATLLVLIEGRQQ